MPNHHPTDMPHATQLHERLQLVSLDGLLDYTMDDDDFEVSLMAEVVPNSREPCVRVFIDTPKIALHLTCSTPLQIGLSRNAAVPLCDEDPLQPAGVHHQAPRQPGIWRGPVPQRARAQHSQSRNCVDYTIAN